MRAAPWIDFDLDVFDPGDVKEMIFVIVDEKPFHLGRIHAAVRLGDIKHRHTEIGENIARHAIDGETARQHRGNHQHQDRYRSTQRKGNEVH